MRRLIMTLVMILVPMTVLVTACGGSSNTTPKVTTSGIAASRKIAQEQQSTAYVQANRLDFRNYNARQKITDDPSTLWWCTLYPPTMGQEPITHVFAGKTTSSTKTPYPPTHDQDHGNYAFTQDPNPASDGMFGSSGEYQYGLDPSGAVITQFNVLYDCGTSPTTYQANSTKIVSGIDPKLLALSQEASALISRAQAEKGAVKLKTLKQASNLIQSAGKVAGQ